MKSCFCIRVYTVCIRTVEKDALQIKKAYYSGSKSF